MRKGMVLGLAVMLAMTLLIANAQAKWSVARESRMQGDVTDIQFIDQTHGWILLAQGEVRYTTDGGKTWNSSKIATNKELHDIHFIDQNRGWIIGENGYMVYTTEAEKHGFR